MSYPLLVLITSLAIDRYYGEYPNRWHPVVWMGQLIAITDRSLQRQSDRQQKLLGICYGIAVPLCIGVACYWLRSILKPSWLLFIFDVFFPQG